MTYSRGSPKKLNELDKRKLPRYEMTQSNPFVMNPLNGNDVSEVGLYPGLLSHSSLLLLPVNQIKEVKTVSYFFKP